MDLVLDLTKQLSREIKKDEAYLEYLRCYETVKKDGELLRKMNEMRKRIIEFQNEADEEHFFQAANALKAEYEYLLNNPDVYSFMKAEMRFCRKMQKIYTILSQDLDIDLDFLS